MVMNRQIEGGLGSGSGLSNADLHKLVVVVVSRVVHEEFSWVFGRFVEELFALMDKRMTVALATNGFDRSGVRVLLIVTLQYVSLPHLWGRRIRFLASV